MNKLLISLSIISLVICQIDNDFLIFSKFQKFIKKYNKKYSSIEEYISRFQIFKKNLHTVISSKSNNYSTGITKFSDLTEKEFSKQYLSTFNYNNLNLRNLNTLKISQSKKNNVPDSFDWRDKNAV